MTSHPNRSAGHPARNPTAAEVRAARKATDRREIMSIPTTKQRNAFPGDRTVVFQSPATDVDGRKWPAGTELTPAAGGYDNTTGGSYQSYTNGARFEGPDKGPK